MLLALQMVDMGVLALYFAALFAIGLYFRSKQRTGRDFFLGSRSLSWLPIGLSLAVSSCSGLAYLQLPGQGYAVGLKLLLLPATVWVTAPLIIWLFPFVYRGLDLFSVYAYLELRFDSTTRVAGTLLFLCSRVIWLVAVLYVPCRLLVIAANVEQPLVLIVVLTGLSATLITLLGGMQGVVWASVVQGSVMFAGVLVVILAAWWGLDGGPTRVWEVATALGRTQIVETGFRWNSSGTVWGLVPHYFVSLLFLFGADQVTVQRFLSARSLPDAQRSVLFHCVLASVAIPVLGYAGLCLLAFYQDNPNDLSAKWIVNVHGESRQSLTYADRARFLGQIPAVGKEHKPLIDWDDPRDAVTAESVDRLVAERRLLHPNRKTPFERADDLRDTEHPERLDLNQFATRLPPKSPLRRGEVVLHARADEELLPWFAAKQLPFGIAGLVVAGVLASSMSSLNSGLLAMSTVVVIDFHRRRSGLPWLESKRSKPESEVAAIEELRLGRFWTLILGVATTTVAATLATQDARIGEIVSNLLSTASSLGAAILGVFLLGLFTRRGTAVGAMTGLICGILLTLCLTFGQRLGQIWPVTFGTLFTFVVGYVASLVVGRRQDRQALRGLVVGCGRLGIRDPRVGQTQR